MTLVVKYSLFAIIATIANIICQIAVNRVYLSQDGLYPSMFLGMLIGLVVKYLLDKNISSFLRAKTCFRMDRNFSFMLQ